jgi:hypothetical protein
MLKKTVPAFLNSLRHGTCPRLAPFSNRSRDWKMVIGPSITPPLVEKQVFSTSG